MITSGSSNPENRLILGAFVQYRKEEGILGLVSKTRAQRIADRIREELSEIMLLHVADPRLESISVTDVTVDRELAYADIYVSALEGIQRSKEVLSGLDNAQGYLRRELTQRLDLRVFPRLRFHWDSTYERAERIEKLISELHRDEIVNKDSDKTNVG